ncbi:MAG: alkaline phosphatase family protein [Planctomycetota bacterium]|nr:alkaline phosphatase family protein [Planctomycetota bacterium]
MKRLLVLDVVGLTPALLGDDTPCLGALAGEGFQAELGAVFPAVTCVAQSSLLTGRLPREHGIVGNGWYFRELAEIRFWCQSNHLVAGPKVWERARQRQPDVRCAKLFWWFNMYSSADISVTPRPLYPADGRKLPDVYCRPPELRRELTRQLGPFPLFRFWGPRADITSSRWIGRCAEHVLEKERPHLTFVYLPHLDYDLQRHGPDFPGLGQALREVDEVAGRLIRRARGMGMEVIVLSEYGITAARGSVSINRVLRAEKLLVVQETLGWELLDAGASRAFAVSDHQVAHVYVRRGSDVPAVRRLLEGVDGIDQVLDREGQRELGVDHPRSGELVAVAASDRWFDYYYWLDDDRAADFARTVDIHRKPGYDPVELFLDPHRRLIPLRIAWKLLAKSLGFRTLLDVIPLDTSLVKGTHGRLPSTPSEGPVLLSSSSRQKTSRLEMTDVSELLLETMFG